MQKLVLLIGLLGLLTVHAEQVETDLLVEDDELGIYIGYYLAYDAGVGTGYWGYSQRDPGMPVVPESAGPTGHGSESYGVDFYSYISLSFYFMLFGAYEITYTFNFIPLYVMPFALQLWWSRPWVGLFGQTSVNPQFQINYWTNFVLGNLITVVTQNLLTTNVSLYDFFFENEDGNEKFVYPSEWDFNMGDNMPQIYADPVWTYNIGSDALNLDLPYFGYGQSLGNRNLATIG